MEIDTHGESQKSPEIAFIFALFDFKSNFKAQNYNKKTTPKSKMEKIFKKLKIISNKEQVYKYPQLKIPSPTRQLIPTVVSVWLQVMASTTSFLLLT